MKNYKYMLSIACFFGILLVIAQVYSEGKSSNRPLKYRNIIYRLIQ